MIEQLITDIEFVILDVLNVKVNLKQIEFQLFFSCLACLRFKRTVVYSEMFCQVIAGPALKRPLIVGLRTSWKKKDTIPRKYLRRIPIHHLFIPFLGPRKLREAHSRRLLVTTAGRALIFSHTTESNYYETDESPPFLRQHWRERPRKMLPGQFTNEGGRYFSFLSAVFKGTDHGYWWPDQLIIRFCGPRISMSDIFQSANLFCQLNAQKNLLNVIS